MRCPPVIGLCRLCEAQSVLRASHILSKFLYRDSGVIGAHRKFDVLCETHPDLTRLNQQDGFKEHLLCGECESTRLAPLERYAQQEFFGSRSPFRHFARVGYEWKGLDYKRMKLFTVSLLWRMSISSLPWFSHVKVGDKHERILRQMLLAGDPREAWRYGCQIGFLLYGGKPLGNPFAGLFAQPRRIPFRIVRYRSVIAGMVWLMYVNSQAPHDGKEGFLSCSGTWMVPAIEANDIPFLREGFEDLRTRESERR